MKQWIRLLGLIVFSALLPNTVVAQAVGGYAAGCQFNAQALPPFGPGFYVLRASRERYYGQSSLIEYLQNLGNKLDQAQFPAMLVADMAKERGGPFAYGHRSHQSGLDADIWLRTPPHTIDSRQLETLSAQDMVNHSHYTLSPHFKDQQRLLIALAAQDPKVSRIFVHPLIKQAMCKAYGDAPWLSRLRPWFGHSKHIHVRLHCPTGDSHCEPQAPVTPGTGCGSELASWINDKDGRLSSGGKRKPYRPTLPKQCQGWVK
ncbi:penicillin-insensitive murein endopeptidase [Oceanisphaera pacifica]|uniref:Penicillin-insensitive murein endopeptidase n=1 Tax=Oceanisphaera pacifica TaxID=2818389 RepID=A0ABS3NG43_9GAMM|nr:penicillin-insensitive murein endopeptidase [Oceanisphaera pacifica]MBO1519507.1 penicillin-insensitive murein endopeptidase [Oceanisphaera pacifica]